MSNTVTPEEALRYHEYPQPGKLETVPTKPYATRRDLAMAYSPGVAYPCVEIKKNPDDVYRYTGKGNLVAVISNGTAVLGLGDIGPAASKPVMEGKAMLFKIFADIDCFDIEVNETDPVRFTETVLAIAGTFGGINLEDIKAPQCFDIEDRLKAVCPIPVMHDDQHGTAIITGAALLNALLLQGKDIHDVRVVVNGAGAAAVACTKMFIALGADPGKVLMCDSKGVIHTGRTDLSAVKQPWARDTGARTLAEAMRGADVFLGVSVADVVTPAMLLSMAPKPIVFALANPNPEIAYDKAMATRQDMIFATGRSDLPNQVNNVLGFPYIFRGALDCRASQINEPMKIAAVHAIASLARDSRRFGPEYIIPGPMDPDLLTTVSPAVARAAARSGVAARPIDDYDAYADELASRINHDHDALKALLSANLRKVAG